MKHSQSLARTAADPVAVADAVLLVLADDAAVMEVTTAIAPFLPDLACRGLIEAQESNGRKTYSLTEAGRAVAEASSDRQAPWQSTREQSSMGALPKAGIGLAQAAAQVHRTGTPEQVKQAVEVLDEARRRLYSILAQDSNQG